MKITFDDPENYFLVDDNSIKVEKDENPPYSPEIREYDDCRYFEKNGDHCKWMGLRYANSCTCMNEKIKDGNCNIYTQKKTEKKQEDAPSKTSSTSDASYEKFIKQFEQSLPNIDDEDENDAKCTEIEKLEDKE